MGAYFGMIYDYICADDPAHTTDVEVEAITDIHCCTTTTVYESDDENHDRHK